MVDEDFRIKLSNYTKNLKKSTKPSQPLDQQKIELAKNLIKKMHPLQHTPIEKIFPMISKPYQIFRKHCFKRKKDEAQKRGSLLRRSTFKRSGSIASVKTPRGDFRRQSSDNNICLLEPMLENMRSTSHLTDQQKVMQERDPFLLLGVGINGYRSFLRTFVFLFFALSLLSIPIATVYSTGTGYAFDFSHHDSNLIKISIGNIGYTSKRCIT